MDAVKKAKIVASLQTDILRLQGFKPSPGITALTGLGPILDAFPGKRFPTGAVHQFISDKRDHAATCGFISGLLSTLMGDNGVTLWIGDTTKIFPPALTFFGVQPHRFIFIDLIKEKEVLWTMEEALKCHALTTVVGEVPDISFTASRRLQLAVEQSLVTGLIVTKPSKKINTNACVSRWKITSLPGLPTGDLPGIGFPSWKVDLLKIRNGKPGVWNVTFREGHFHVDETQTVVPAKLLKAG
jgi:protein ImuA